MNQRIDNTVLQRVNTVSKGESEGRDEAFMDALGLASAQPSDLRSARWTPTTMRSSLAAETQYGRYFDLEQLRTWGDKLGASLMTDSVILKDILAKSYSHSFKGQKQYSVDKFTKLMFEKFDTMQPGITYAGFTSMLDILSSPSRERVVKTTAA